METQRNRSKSPALRYAPKTQRTAADNVAAVHNHRLSHRSCILGLHRR
jgi:hypothetical protein